MNPNGLEPVFDDNTQEILQFRPFVFDDFLKEVCYHEASHYVFGQLVLKMDLGFSPHLKISIEVDEELKLSDSKVCGCGFEPSKSIIPNHESFYKGDDRRIFSKIFVLLAGYASMQVFIDKDCKYFIGGIVDWAKQQIPYYLLRTAPAPKNGKKGISDIRKAKKYLRKYKGLDEEIQYEILEEIISGIQNLMKNNPKIQKAICWLGEHLSKRNKQPIEGDNLSLINEKIDGILENVSLEDTISKYI